MTKQLYICNRSGDLPHCRRCPHGTPHTPDRTDYGGPKECTEERECVNIPAMLDKKVKCIVNVPRKKETVPAPVKDIGETSDGYHTFNELYEHRHALFGLVVKNNYGWKSMKHSDGSDSYPGWFIAGVETPFGQITYHIPMRLWDEFPGAVIDEAVEYDRHTPADVVDRLKKLWNYHYPGHLKNP